MEFTFLGVDACIPAPGSDTASYLFERGLMIDVGWHATETLRRCGKTPADVRSVLFTHCHHDHVMALPALLYERFAQSTAGELHLYGPEPLCETLERAIRFLQTEIYWPEARRRFCTFFPAEKRSKSADTPFARCKAGMPFPESAIALRKTGAPSGSPAIRRPFPGSARFSAAARP